MTKPQNVVLGLGDLRHTAFIIDFGIAKEFWNMSTSVHIPFRQGQCLTGTPAFASINNHLGVEPGRRDDLESLTYMLIYFLQGSLPWLTSGPRETFQCFHTRAQSEHHHRRFMSWNSCRVCNNSHLHVLTCILRGSRL